MSFDPEQVIYFNLSFPIYTTTLGIHELLLGLSKINYVKHLAGAWNEINLNKISILGFPVGLVADSMLPGQEAWV